MIGFVRHARSVHCHAVLAVLALAVLAVNPGCSSEEPNNASSFDGRNDSKGAGAAGNAEGVGTPATIDAVFDVRGRSLEGAQVRIAPSSAELESINQAQVTVQFKASLLFSDGSSEEAKTALPWVSKNLAVGTIAPTGQFTSAGYVGGTSEVSVNLGGLVATAKVSVKAKVVRSVAPSLAAETVTALRGALDATTFSSLADDASSKWAYPYHGTVFPRGLTAPSLMWTSESTGTSAYLVNIRAPQFELEAVTEAGAKGKFVFSPDEWRQFTDSTSGKAKIRVVRLDGTTPKRVVDHEWTIAPGSMRGTIYYWAQNIGRVVRIKPGAATYDDFAKREPFFLKDATGAITDAADTTTYGATTCVMTCHTVSADGATLISGGGRFGGSYDLRSLLPIKSVSKHTTGVEQVWGGTGVTVEAKWRNIQWANSALAKDGAYVVINETARQLAKAASGDIGSLPLVWNAKTGEPIANGETLPADFAQRVYHPSFSPDGHSLVYFSGEPAPRGSWARNAKDSSLWVMDFDPSAKPMLRNPRRLVGAGSHPSTTFGTATNSANMAYPTVSPDGKWVIFQRANMLATTPGAENAELDNRSVFGDLSIVSTDAKGGTSDTPLDQLNGKGYPFAAGAERDMHYNYEPTLAPVAAGGYFWVVFSSRRTFGTELTGAPNPDTKTKYEGIKQLWVAAIDPNVEPGKDPSHPPFRLEGQSLTPNVRGFWALDPCKNDGSSCENGTECCGGYCDKGATVPVCRSSLPTCSANGDRCQQTTDCCGASAGVQCINEVCSEPMPK